MNKILYEIKHLGKNIEDFSKIDFFILAGGNDFRAYEILKKCKNSNIDIHNILLFNFKERVQITKKNDKYFNFRKFKSNNLDLIECSISNPESCLSNLLSKMASFSNSKSIAIDISCFTKPYFFYVLKFLKERFDIEEISVFYSEPLTYLFPNKGLFSSYEESIGPIIVKEIPGFNGIEQRNFENILIVLLGFEGNLLLDINEDVSHREFFMINGFPAYSPKFKDISLVNNENYISNKDRNILYSRASNPFDVFNLLEKIKRNYLNSSIHIAPLGTKPMALGACLFAIHNPEVRVIFPFSDNYSNETTKKCLNSWLYKAPLKFT